MNLVGQFLDKSYEYTKLEQSITSNIILRNEVDKEQYKKKKSKEINEIKVNTLEIIELYHNVIRESISEITNEIEESLRYYKNSNLLAEEYSYNRFIALPPLNKSNMTKYEYKKYKRMKSLLLNHDIDDIEVQTELISEGGTTYDIMMLLFYGIGVERDYEKVYDFLMYALDKDNWYEFTENIDVNIILGYFYYNGYCVEKDEVRAFEYYQCANTMYNMVFNSEIKEILDMIVSEQKLEAIRLIEIKLEVEIERANNEEIKIFLEKLLTYLYSYIDQNKAIYHYHLYVNKVLKYITDYMVYMGRFEIVETEENHIRLACIKQAYSKFTQSFYMLMSINIIP